MALNEGTRVNRQQLVPNVTHHMGALGQLNFARTDTAIDPTANHDIVSYNLAVNRRALTNGEGICSDIAVNRTVDLNLTLRAEVADDLQVGANE
jgi:hypothetical protein